MYIGSDERARWFHTLALNAIHPLTDMPAPFQSMHAHCHQHIMLLAKSLTRLVGLQTVQAQPFQHSPAAAVQVDLMRPL